MIRKFKHDEQIAVRVENSGGPAIRGVVYFPMNNPAEAMQVRRELEDYGHANPTIVSRVVSTQGFYRAHGGQLASEFVPLEEVSTDWEEVLTSDGEF